MPDLKSIITVLALGVALTAVADGFDRRHSGMMVPGPARENIRSLRPVRDTSGARFFRTPQQVRAVREAAPSEIEKARGLLLKTYSWNYESDNHAEGIYEVPLGGSAPSAFATIKDLSDLPWTMFGVWSAVYSPEAYYLSLVDYQKGQFAGLFHYVYNPDTWELVNSWYTKDNGIWVNTSAYDPTSGMVYAQMTQANDHYNNFGTFDCLTGAYREIKRGQTNDVISNLYYLAFTSDGQLYGLYYDRGDDNDTMYKLVKVDKNSGVTSLVGKTGIDSGKLGGNSAVVMSDDDKYMYFMTGGLFNNTGGYLYKVTLADGTTTPVYTTSDGETFKMLYKPVKPADGVPQAVTDITPVFNADALSGQVRFTMPSLTIAGKNLSGLLQYDLTFNGAERKTGFAEPGKTVTVNATLPASGRYTIGVRVKNSTGYSPIATNICFIGADVPTAATNVKAVYADGVFTVTWDEPVAADGGYFDPSKLSYDVVAYTGAQPAVIASKRTSRSVTYRFAEPADYFADCYFRVSPWYDGVEYGSSSSNHVVVGNMVLPWTPDFAANFIGFSSVNANGDHRKFVFSTLWEQITLDGNENERSDDWCFTPPVNMEHGKAYRIDYNLRCRGNKYPETYSIWAGNDSTVAAMTKCIHPETTFDDTEWDYTGHGYYAPPADGRFFYGLHCTSQPQNSTLYVDGITISEPVSADLAEEPSDFRVVRSDDGTLKAIITFKAPAAELSGKPLSAIDRLVIKRDGEEIATLQASPGQSVRYEDTTVPENAVYTYGALAYTSAGAGMESVGKAFIGVRVPEEMSWVTAKYGVDNGHFIIEWDSPAVDVAGEPFDEEQLRYNLYRNEGGRQVLIAGDLKEKRRVYRACDADAEQQFLYFGVEPVNNAGAGYGLTCEAIPAGRPDKAPYAESFSNKSPHKLYTLEYHPYYYAIWIFSSDTDFPDIQSFDNDNGFLVFGSEDAGNVASYVSGNIDLDGTERPVMTYYYYTWEWSNTVEVLVNDGDGWVSLDNFATNEQYSRTRKEGWVRRSIDLSAYKGKQIRYKFTGECVDAIYSLIDNLFIGDAHDNDVAVGKLNAPTRVAGGMPFKITTSVYNYGAKDSSPYTVTLYVDGQPSETKEFKSLPVGQHEEVSFIRRIMLGEEANHTYYAVVESDGDEDLSNNRSVEIEVSRNATVYPEPRNLEASSAGGTVTLAWEAPDLSGQRRVTVTDDVEEYTDFSIGLPGSVIGNDYVGDWTMIDADDTNTYTFSGGSFKNAQNKMAYIVMNPEAIGIDTELESAWRPASGQKVFASFLPLRVRNEDMSETPVDKDDWLVSPLLTGDAQTISFMARTVSLSYEKEKFEVWYTTSTEPATDNMVRIGDTMEAPYEWEKFEFDLPAGARYFAIRNIGSDAFVFFIDDITYQSGAAAGIGLELTGYNVYRNGVLLTAGSPTVDRVFADSAPGSDTPSYQVTAVYDRGESMPARISLDQVGLGAAMEQGASVGATENSIIVTGASGRQINVMTPDGRLVRSIASGASVTRIPATAGIYLVTVGNETFKVVVG